MSRNKSISDTCLGKKTIKCNSKEETAFGSDRKKLGKDDPKELIEIKAFDESTSEQMASTSSLFMENPANFQTQEEKSIVPNLGRFKYTRPHVKIEYENEAKNEGQEEKAKGLWEPPHWQEFLVNLKNMRSNNDAPVDSMGCHMTMDRNATPEVIRYQTLVALMLSSQTKDEVTFAAMERLRARGLTVDNVLAMSDEELGKLIYPVGFWKTKVKYIKKTTQTLRDLYNGDIPDSVDKLCKLTGVGPKMAHICMKVAWNKVTGIGVDTHVHRISNRIGWVQKPTATPEDTRKALEKWLPFELWSEVNHLMVGFGQTICLPIGPLCHECLNNDICPSSNLGRKTPNKKSPKTKSPKKIKENKSVDDFEMKEEPFVEQPEVQVVQKLKIPPKKETVDCSNQNNEITVAIIVTQSSQNKQKVTSNIQVTNENSGEGKKRLKAKSPIEINNENDLETNKESFFEEPKLTTVRKRKITPKNKIVEGNQDHISPEKEITKVSPKQKRATLMKGKTKDITASDSEEITKVILQKKRTTSTKGETKDIGTSDNAETIKDAQKQKRVTSVKEETKNSGTSDVEKSQKIKSSKKSKDDDFDIKDTVFLEEPKQKTVRKRKITPKKETVEGQQQDPISKNEEVTVQVVVKVSPKQNTVTYKKEETIGVDSIEVVKDSNVSTSEIKSTRNKRKLLSSKNINPAT